MLKFQDKITLGVFAGVIANIIRNTIGFITYFSGIKEYHIWHFAASAYLTKEEVNTFWGMLLGMFTDYAIACFLGIFTVYFLLMVGIKNYILKGIIVGTGAWLLIFTLVVRFEISKIAPITPLESIVFFFNHLLIGILIVIIINKYGKNLIKNYFD